MPTGLLHGDHRMHRIGIVCGHEVGTTISSYVWQSLLEFRSKWNQVTLVRIVNVDSRQREAKFDTAATPEVAWQHRWRNLHRAHPLACSSAGISSSHNIELPNAALKTPASKNKNHEIPMSHLIV